MALILSALKRIMGTGGNRNRTDMVFHVLKNELRKNFKKIPAGTNELVRVDVCCIHAVRTSINRE